jgi:anti-sigma factor RsiW
LNPMTCADVDHLADAFIDTELTPGEMIAVARHAGTCSACDAAIRDLETMRHVMGALVDAEVDALDFSRVWPRVAVGVDAAAARRAKVRHLRQLPVWGVALALAASLVLFFMPSEQPVQRADVHRPRAASRLASLPNYAQIDRLAGKNIAVRREPKDGTTMIWVTRQVADAR